ncbi:MAG TPA: glycosyl hydrolase [Anaerolineae bacterium]
MYIHLIKRLFILPLTIIAAATALISCSGRESSVEMPHIHGLGFSPDGRQLIVPAHDGLRVFADGEWSVPEVPAHDYMGYTPVDNGFYSSGHPHPSSGLVNPFGLVKSTDGGQTLEKLGFEGESDFHLMGVGYENHAVYVLNPASNSQLSTGLHVSLDDGQTWQPCAAQGVSARPFQIAVHPTEASVVAVATEGGLFLSTDYGDSFTRVGEAVPVTAVAFYPNGQTLLFGASRLFAYDLSSEQITAFPSPTFAADDAIGYVAVNPIQAGEIALATFSRDIYLSSDGGQAWPQIAEDGKAK